MCRYASQQWSSKSKTKNECSAFKDGLEPTILLKHYLLLSLCTTMNHRVQPVREWLTNNNNEWLPALFVGLPAIDKATSVGMFYIWIFNYEYSIDPDYVIKVSLQLFLRVVAVPMTFSIVFLELMYWMCPTFWACILCLYGENKWTVTLG
jgi:hypothetical protein